jgi:hypothetical protein
MALNRRRNVLLFSAAILLTAAPGYSSAREGEADYPPADDRQALIAWLGERTNIEAASVVSVTPELVVAIVGKTQPPTPGGPVRLTLREEVIAAPYVDSVGGRSSLMSMEIQCEERRVRMDERRLYAGANLGGSVDVSEPSSTWVRIPEGSIMDDVARAVCDDGYSWPLQSVQAKLPVTAPTVLAAAAPAPPVAPPAPQPVIADAPQVEAEASPPPPAPEPAGATEASVAAPPQVTAPTVLAAAEPLPPAAAPSPASASVIAPEVELEALPPQEPAVAVAEAPVTAPPDVVSPEPATPVPAQVEPVDLPVVVPVPESIPAPEPEPPASPEIPTVNDGPVFAIQIGAYEAEEMAQAAWRALSMNRPVLVEGLRFEIRPVRVKGRNWLRGLVRDFATKEDATAFCTALAGTEYGCILRPLAD